MEKKIMQESNGKVEEITQEKLNELKNNPQSQVKIEETENITKATVQTLMYD